MSRFSSDSPSQQSSQQDASRGSAGRSSAAQPSLKLKTYRAWTMAEALATVKSDLGSDAIILHTRTFERGGFFGFGRRTVVELTAARAADVPAEPSSSGPSSSKSASSQSASMAPAPRAASRAAAVEPKETLAMSAAARAYSAQPAPAAQGGAAESGAGKGGFDLEAEREKTRRLAQAMAIQLEKQASTRESAAQNERATVQSGAASAAAAAAAAAVASQSPATKLSSKPSSKPSPKLPSGVSSAASTAATASQAAPSSRVPSHPLPTTESVAQRFVLVAQPAAQGAKSGLVAQLATALPKAAAPVAAAPVAPVGASTPAVATPAVATPAKPAVQASPAVSPTPGAAANPVASWPTEPTAPRDAQVGMAAFVPMEFMQPEPVAASAVAKPAEIAASVEGLDSAAFVSAISMTPSTNESRVEAEVGLDGFVDAQVAELVEDSRDAEVEVEAEVEIEVEVEVEVEAAAAASPTPASSAISIAAPLSSAEPTVRAPSRGSDELDAISDFVGRVLEGRVLEGRVLEGRVLEVRAPEARVAPAASIEPKPRAAVAPAARRPEPVVERLTPAPAPVASPSPARTEVIERAYARLIEQEVAAELAERIVESVAREMQAALDAGAEPSEQVVRAAIERRIASLLPADAEDGLGGASSRMLPGKFGARRIAFIGPTGVGKTTTLAKIAAQLKLKRGLSVGIVAADTYRIAAVDQLRTYAEILEVPVEVASSPSDADRACERLAVEHGVDVILIDTAGRSQNDRMKLSELRAFLNAAQPDETHLVLSATAGARTLEREATAFGAVGIDRIVLTKLDEAATFGTLISLVERLGKRVSFLTHGQEVPDHIEPGRGRRLAELVMGSEVR